MPNNLKELICSNNEILELDNLPKNLIKLNCVKNKIIKFNNLPHNLKEFKYDDDKIKNINGQEITFWKTIYRKNDDLNINDFIQENKKENKKTTNIEYRHQNKINKCLCKNMFR